MKPVGLVHIAAARENRSILHEAHRFGDIGRSEIRMKAVEAALELLRPSSLTSLRARPRNASVVRSSTRPNAATHDHVQDRIAQFEGDREIDLAVFAFAA